MKPHRNHKGKSTEKKYGRMAAAFAGAALLSAALFNPMASAATPQAPVDQGVATQKAAPVQKGMAKHVKVGQKKAVDQAAKQAVKNKQAKKAKQATEKSQKATESKQVINVTATAYAPGPHDNDQWGSKTYLGTQIRPGVIAVDPNVIPLGSTVKIEFPNGETMHAVAEDTGGAIKGNRIDVAKWSVPEAEQFGMKDAKVTILQKGDKS